MRCLACQKVLSDKEANRKFENYEEIVSPEDRYIGLCSNCSYDYPDLDDFPNILEEI